jgi:hypothetical protein
VVILRSLKEDIRESSYLVDIAQAARRIKVNMHTYSKSH